VVSYFYGTDFLTSTFGAALMTSLTGYGAGLGLVMNSLSSMSSLLVSIPYSGAFGSFFISNFV
jgi:hypothetical protein